MKYVWLLLLCGCSSTNEALDASVVVVRESAKRLESDFQRYVQVASDEIEEKSLTILDDERDRRILAASQDGLTEDEVKAESSWYAGEREAVKAALAKKREELKSSPNLQLIEEMTQVQRDYLRTTSAAFRELEAIIGRVQK